MTHDPATIFILVVASLFVLDLLIGWAKSR
jgi:hypothetical protein